MIIAVAGDPAMGTVQREASSSHVPMAIRKLECSMIPVVHAVQRRRNDVAVYARRAVQYSRFPVNFYADQGHKTVLLCRSTRCR